MKMRNLVLLVAAALVFACSDSPQPELAKTVEPAETKVAKTVDQNQIFEQFKISFLEEFWSLNPG